MRKGLICGVYTSKEIGDCSFSGVSSRYDSCLLTGEGVDGPFGPSARTPELRLCVEEICGGQITRICARPVDPKTGEVFEGYFMAGGNFIYACDSRFPEIKGRKAPISVHDRAEDEETRRRVAEAYPGK